MKSNQRSLFKINSTSQSDCITLCENQQDDLLDFYTVINDKIDREIKDNLVNLFQDISDDTLKRKAGRQLINIIIKAASL